MARIIDTGYKTDGANGDEGTFFARDSNAMSRNINSALAKADIGDDVENDELLGAAVEYVAHTTLFEDLGTENNVVVSKAGNGVNITRATPGINVVFKCKVTATGSTTLRIIGATDALPLLKSNGEELKDGDIREGNIYTAILSVDGSKFTLMEFGANQNQIDTHSINRNLKLLTTTDSSETSLTLRTPLDLSSIDTLRDGEMITFISTAKYGTDLTVTLTGSNNSSLSPLVVEDILTGIVENEMVTLSYNATTNTLVSVNNTSVSTNTNEILGSVDDNAFRGNTFINRYNEVYSLHVDEAGTEKWIKIGSVLPEEPGMTSISMDTDYGVLAVIMDNNRLFMCGNNDYGALGLGDEDERLTLKNTGIFARSVVTYGKSTWAINMDWKLASTGNNHVGQLGVGDDDDRSVFTVSDYLTVKQLMLPIRDTRNGKSVSSGMTLIDGGGYLRAAGSNRNYNMGLPDDDEYHTFRRVIDRPIKLFAASHYNAGIITSDDVLWTCGRNYSGDCGLGHGNITSPFTTTRRKARNFTPLWYRTFMENMDGILESTGYNGRGALSLGDEDDRYTYTNTGIKAGKVVGYYGTTYLLHPNGFIYTCGDNREEECLLGHTDDVLTLTKTSIAAKDIEVLHGLSQVFDLYIITDDDKLMVVGDNIDGELGLGHNDPVPRPILTDQSVSKLLGGSKILDGDGVLKAAGNNGGSFNNGTSDNYNVFTRVNIPDNALKDVLPTINKGE